ncbi:MAG: alpha/beta fold hydrolase, partial [Rhizobiaceae bacterium]
MNPQERTGSAKKPLLLLPGTACDARVFAPLLHALDNVDAIIGDMSGAQTMPDLARKILSTAPARFSLLGFSLGGMAALEMIAQRPDRVERLCLVDTTPRPDPEANAAVRRAAVARARADGMDTFILDTWPKPVSSANAADVTLRDTICAMARSTAPDALAGHAEVAIHRADSRPRLGNIAVPTLILAGEDERVCPLDAHQEMAEGIRGSEYHLIPNAGHFALLENPAAVTVHVRRWLNAAPNALHLIAQQAAGVFFMSEADNQSKTAKAVSQLPRKASEPVLQVERRDYTELAPADRARVQPKDGFDEIYTEIVDYSVRCTHKSWDERN